MFSTAVTMEEQEIYIPPTPTSVEEFNKEWIKFVMDDWFIKNDIKTESVDIVSFSASLNSLQVRQRTKNLLVDIYIIPYLLPLTPFLLLPWGYT